MLPGSSLPTVAIPKRLPINTLPKSIIPGMPGGKTTSLDGILRLPYYYCINSQNSFITGFNRDKYIFIAWWREKSLIIE